MRERKIYLNPDVVHTRETLREPAIFDNRKVCEPAIVARDHRECRGLVRREAEPAGGRSRAGRPERAAGLREVGRN